MSTLQKWMMKIKLDVWDQSWPWRGQRHVWILRNICKSYESESSEERVNLDSCFQINYISKLSKGVIKKYFWKLKNIQQSKIWSYFNRDALRSGVTALIAVVKTLFVPPPQFRSTTWIVCVFCSYSLFLWKNLRLLMFENWMQDTEKLFIKGGD